MKRILVLSLMFAGSCCAQWGIVYDPSNYGINAENLAQMEELYQTFVQYRHFTQLAQGMFHCPTCFMDRANLAVGAVQSIMIENGHWDPKDPETARKIANLHKIMAVGQTAISEAQLGKAMSTGNGASVAYLTIEMARVAEQTNAEMRRLTQDNQIGYYKRLRGYTPQMQVINRWRLK